MLFREADFAEAKELFEVLLPATKLTVQLCLGICPEDLTSKLYVERCSILLDGQMFDKSTWNGVYKLDHK